MIGLFDPGPKPRSATPGSRSIVVARSPPDSRTISIPWTVDTELNASSDVSVPAGEAVTVKSSCNGERLSTKFAVAVPPDSTITACRPAVRCSRCARTSYSPAGIPSISNLPSLSVSAATPEPTTTTTAPRMKSPLSSSVTVPRTVPLSLASSGVKAAGGQHGRDKACRHRSVYVPCSLSVYPFSSIHLSSSLPESQWFIDPPPS